MEPRRVEDVSGGGVGRGGRSVAESPPPRGDARAEEGRGLRGLEVDGDRLLDRLRLAYGDRRDRSSRAAHALHAVLDGGREGSLTGYVGVVAVVRDIVVGIPGHSVSQ